MPLIKSTSKKAFGENIARERSAGKPIKQAVAIAYSERREAARGKSDRETKSDTGKEAATQSHSSHSSARSDHYHSRVVDASAVRPSETKMTRSEHSINNMEEVNGVGSYTGRLK